jgi:four helix bundle protein
MGWHFDHEGMDVYILAVRVARWVRGVKWPTGTGHLRDNAVRSSESMVLNIAEGRSRGGKAGKNHYRIAQGSAAECCAVLDLVDLDEGPEHQALLRRVGHMLQSMKR